MKKEIIIIIGLLVVIFLIAQYVILDKWNEVSQQKVMGAYQAGYDQGLVDAVTTVFGRTQNCQSATLTIGNLTKQVFDSECLKNLTEGSEP